MELSRLCRSVRKPLECGALYAGINNDRASRMEVWTGPASTAEELGEAKGGTRFGRLRNCWYKKKKSSRDRDKFDDRLMAWLLCGR